jgi:hypothetical protein
MLSKTSMMRIAKHCTINLRRYFKKTATQASKQFGHNSAALDINDELAEVFAPNKNADL